MMGVHSKSKADAQNMQNFKALRSKFQEKAEDNWIWQLIFGLWKIWYDWYDYFVQYIHVKYQYVHKDIISYHISQFEI